MLTIKKQAYGIAVLAAGAAACLLLSGCEPPGSRALHRGDDLIKQGQYEEAVSTLREAVGLLAHEPPAVQARAWNLLGLAYQHIGQGADARKCYGQALKLDRNLSVTDYNLGCLELEEKHYAQAIDYFTTYTNVRPRDVVGYVKLGSARLRYALQIPNPLEKHRQLDEAKRVYEAAQSLGLTSEACNGLGVIELEHRSPPTAASVKAAEKLFATAFQHDPRYAPAILNQGIVCDEYLNDLKTALIKYKEYLLLETNAPNSKQVATEAHTIDEELRISVVPETPVRESRPPSSNQTAAVTPPPRPRAAPPPSQASQASPPPVTQTTVERELAPSVPKPKEPLTASVARPAAQTPTETPAPSRPVPLPATNETAPPQVEPPQSNNIASEPTTNSVPAASAEPAGQSNNVAENNVSKPSEPPPHKDGFVINLFKRINPANWFNGKREKSSEDGSPPVHSQTPAGSGASAPTAPSAAPATHYSPPTLSVLTRGNREEAMKLVAQAAAATRESRQGDALESLREAVKADPTCYEASFALGMAYIDGKNYPAATEVLYQALLIHEDSADARYAFAWALERQHFYQDAANELEKLLAQHVGEVRGHLLLGNIYARQLDQPKQARQQYAAVLALDPANSQAPALRSWLHENSAQ